MQASTIPTQIRVAVAISRWTNYRGFPDPLAARLNYRLYMSLMFKIGQTDGAVEPRQKVLAGQDGELKLFCWDFVADTNVGQIKALVTVYP